MPDPLSHDAELLTPDEAERRARSFAPWLDQRWCTVPEFARFSYWRDAAKTAAAWRETPHGPAFTVGDAGALDDDGYLSLRGRAPPDHHRQGPPPAPAGLVRAELIRSSRSPAARSRTGSGELLVRGHGRAARHTARPPAIT